MGIKDIIHWRFISDFLELLVYRFYLKIVIKTGLHDSNSGLLELVTKGCSVQSLFFVVNHLTEFLFFGTGEV